MTGISEGAIESMEVVLEEKDAADWIYRGEGAVNLVLAYKGSSPDFVGKVIRIPKTPQSRSQCNTDAPVLSMLECLLWKDANNLVSSTSMEAVQQLYVLYVMKPLLGSEHVDVGVRVRVSSKFLETVDNNVRCQRPSWRVFAAKVNTLCDSALLMTDHSVFPHELTSYYTDRDAKLCIPREYRIFRTENNLKIASKVLLVSQLPGWNLGASLPAGILTNAPQIPIQLLIGPLKESLCISVEIKEAQPKCGFIPCSRFIAKGNAIKSSITRFRMHQVLKLSQGEISQISEYHPLDLFSGSSDRIHKAIKALFTTPQNNFRIFRNGSLIFGGLGGGTDNTNTNFMDSEAFEDSIEGLIQADDGLHTASFLRLVSEAIFKSGVLDRLLEAQKLDLLDIEGAIHAYYNIVSQPCKICRDLGDSELSRIYSSLHSISLEESLRIVKDYLIAATAKDCSLMISFRKREDDYPGSPHPTVYLESTNQSFDYKVHFIDLDMKPLEKVAYYYELDQKIVSCYTQMKMEHGPSDFGSNGGSQTTDIQHNSIDECPH